MTLLHLDSVMMSFEAVLESLPFSMYTQQVSLTMRLMLMRGFLLLGSEGRTK